MNVKTIFAGYSNVASRFVLLASGIAASGLSAWATWTSDLNHARSAAESFSTVADAGQQTWQGSGAPMHLAAQGNDSPLSLAPRIGDIVPRASRNVTPPGMTPGPPITGPLVRVPSPVPPKPRRKPPPRSRRLYDPEVASAAIVVTSAGLVRIAGITAPQVEDSCGTGKMSWPCGKTAQAQLRRLIRGRAIECEIPFGIDELPKVTRCSVAGQDIGEWLVWHGWALPSGSSYSSAAEEAQRAKRGLWGKGRSSSAVCFSNC